MIKLSRLGACLLACVVALLTAGCKTPPAVYELAEKSSVNAGVFQGHLAELAAQSEALAKERANNIVALEALNARLEGELKRELYMQQHSRSSADWAEMKALMDRLSGLRDDLIKIEKDAGFAAADRRAALLAGQTGLNAYKAALRETSAALGTLAKEESRTERVKFFRAFVREVRTDMKAAAERGDADAVKAKELLDDISGQLKNGDAD